MRLRRFGDRAWLTLKAPVAGTHRHKVREEHETPVTDPGAMDRILEHLGFVPAYRYQKFRTRYELYRDGKEIGRLVPVAPIRGGYELQLEEGASERKDLLVALAVAITLGGDF